MSISEIILFEFGTEGGGAIVYKLLNNKVVEKGSSGGMLDDEEEDPIKEWEETFDSWENWWSNFISEHKENWIYFYPLFISEDIKANIQTSVDNYQASDDSHLFHKENWLRILNEKY